MNRSLRKTMVAATALAMVAGAGGMKVYHRPANADGSHMVADLSDKILYLYDAGSNEPQMFDIATGRDSYPTPTGQFTIRKLTWNPRWVPPDSKWAEKKHATAPDDPRNPMKVVKIFFKEPDYYIHGTDDVGSLGSNESHGCLRMAPDDVMKVGKWVMEHGGQPQGENWFYRILHFRSQEKSIYLPNPVPIKVQP